MAVDFPFHWISGLPPEAQREIELDLLKLAKAIDGAGGTAPANGVYGDGSDGVITFDGTTTVLGFAPSSTVYTLTRDIYLAGGSSLSVGATIITAGYRIFCTGTFTMSGTVHNNGTTAGNVDAAGNAGTSGLGALAAVFGVTNVVGGSAAKGGAGGAASATSNSLGGSGGAGGSASSGGTGTGVASGAATAPSAAVGGYPRNLWSAMSGEVVVANAHYDYGSGGAGGSSTGGVARGGGGGGGGGIVGLYIFTLVNTGAIQAKGGNGGNAGGATGNGGGGGGGGGGGIIIICGPGSTTGTLTVTGGTGGALLGTGGTGASGASGHTFVLAG